MSQPFHLVIKSLELIVPGPEHQPGTTLTRVSVAPAVAEAYGLGKSTHSRMAWCLKLGRLFMTGGTEDTKNTFYGWEIADAVEAAVNKLLKGHKQ